MRQEINRPSQTAQGCPAIETGDGVRIRAPYKTPKREAAGRRGGKLAPKKMERPSLSKPEQHQLIKL